MVAADAHHGASAGVEVVEVSRSKVTTARNERSPLLRKPEEEVYPLPWFRSPEGTRHPPPPARNPGRHRQSAATPDAGSDSDMELGYLVRRPANASEADAEADSLKQCIQFLVGLILIMAMALILLIIFQPQPDSSR